MKNPVPNDSNKDGLMEIPNKTYHPRTYIDLDLFSAKQKDLFSSAAIMSSCHIPNFLGSKGCSLSKEEMASMKYLCDSFKAMCMSLWLCIDGINWNPGPEMSTILVMMMCLFKAHEELWMRVKFSNKYLTNYHILNTSSLQGNQIKHTSQAINWTITQKKLKKLSSSKVGQQGSSRHSSGDQQGSHSQHSHPNNHYQQSNKPTKSGGCGTGSSAPQD